MSRLVARLLALSSSIVLAGVSLAQTLESRPPQAPAAPVAPRALANNEPNYLKLRNIKAGNRDSPRKGLHFKAGSGDLYVQERSFSIGGAGEWKDYGRSFCGRWKFCPDSSY